MDKTHTIQSLTDDILNEVSERDSLEKTAAAKPVEMKTKVGAGLVKLAAELREMSKKDPEVTNADLAKFAEKLGV